MSKRYQVTDGIVIRRTELPSGDIVATLFGEQGKWRGIARKGKLPGGNLGRISLFHDVTVQYYRKRDEDLVLMTQIQLNGAMPGLTSPAVYPFAHVLAELVDKLSVDVHAGENLYNYLAGGLRGLSQHHDPEAVALVICWKLLQGAGLAPRVTRCAQCSTTEVGSLFDVAAGGLTCGTCNSGMRLPESVVSDLQVVLLRTVREALELPLEERSMHWVLLSRYITFHVGELHSLIQLRSYA